MLNDFASVKEAFVTKGIDTAGRPDDPRSQAFYPTYPHSLGKTAFYFTYPHSLGKTSVQITDGTGR